MKEPINPVDSMGAPEPTMDVMLCPDCGAEQEHIMKKVGAVTLGNKVCHGLDQCPCGTRYSFEVVLRAYYTAFKQ